MFLFILMLIASTSALPPLIPRPPSDSLNAQPIVLGPQNSTSHVHIQNVTYSRICGTGPPTKALVDAHTRFRSKALQKREPPQTSRYTVDTYFHIISTEDQADMVTTEMVSKQLGAMQTAYAAANIFFDLISTDYTINDTWATDANDADLKLALRKGNYSALNVYFQTNLSSIVDGTPSQMLGYCTLPTNVTYSPCDGCEEAEFPSTDYAMDGCNVLAGSMPNGTVDGYNQGKTAVHEIGHWFGLLHTFQDNTCASDDGGDFIDDTPIESASTDGCPVGKDSCPDSPGLDPIHNFMDYSSDDW